MTVSTATFTSRSAIASLWLGGGALALSPVPILNNIGFMLGIMGLVFGVVALCNRGSWGSPTAGLLLSALGITITLVMQAHWAAELDKLQQQIEQIQEPAWPTGVQQP